MADMDAVALLRNEIIRLQHELEPYAARYQSEYQQTRSLHQTDVQRSWRLRNDAEQIQRAIGSLEMAAKYLSAVE
jgi:hypothetical protein